MRASNWIDQADQAMIRAAARARAVAASTHTAIHIMKDGKILEIRTGKEDPHSAPAELQDEAELSIVREDTPPYGNQKARVGLWKQTPAAATTKTPARNSRASLS